MAKRSTTKDNKKLVGTNNNDTLTVKHESNPVYGYKGADKINVTKGSKHKIFGGYGNDKITIGKNAGDSITIYGDQTKDIPKKIKASKNRQFLRLGLAILCQNFTRAKCPKYYEV